VNRWKALALDDAEPKRLLAKRLRGRVRTRASPHPLQQRTPSATLGPPVFASAWTKEGVLRRPRSRLAALGLLSAHKQFRKWPADDYVGACSAMGCPFTW